MDQACSESPCPVPHDQRPLEEYRQLCSSWFFAWPSLTSAGLWRPLLISWLLSLPLTALISSGSWTLRHDPLRQVATAVVAAVLPALLLLSRQWLGWSYVNRRLIAERVEYEESGWYDGQVWEKPSPGASRICLWPATRCGRCWCGCGRPSAWPCCCCSAALASARLSERSTRGPHFPR